jgi:hypothetical protein
MADQDDQGALPDKIEYHYQKSPGYRTVHADGAHGGGTTRGYLAVTFYNERGTIPRRGSRAVDVNDQGEPRLGREVVEEGLTGIMRQLEVTVMLDINAARELTTWLVRHVKEIEDAFEVPEDQRWKPAAEKTDGD